MSRLHAWIDVDGAECFVADAGSRTGTFVNDQRIEGRHGLRDGDVIRVGSARLMFVGGGNLPVGVAMGRLESRETDRGILFQCDCGMALWAGSVLAGRAARCVRCNGRLTIPKPAMADAAGEARPAAEAQAGLCSVCQSPVERGDATTTCPECHLSFHSECWTENRGCSAYGCSQVNVLAPVMETPKERTVFSGEANQANGHSSVPWEFVLLGMAVMGGVLSLFVYGVPSAIVAIGALGLLIRSRADNRWALWVALVLSLAGGAGGVAIARLW